jgi:hypothetical protein
MQNLFVRRTRLRAPTDAGDRTEREAPTSRKKLALQPRFARSRDRIVEVGMTPPDESNTLPNRTAMNLV